MDLSANGLKLQTGTVETLVGGGVAFEVPKDFPLGERITERAYFTVHPDYESIHDKQFKFSTNYILRIDDSISGLSVGAPVEFRGVNVGRVARTDIHYGESLNLLDKTSRIPVMISLEPGRMGLEDSEQGVARADQDIKRWIKEGLKATLNTGNLLIGSQLVELNYYEDQPLSELEQFNGMVVIPVAPDDFTQLGSDISDLVNTLKSLPLINIANNMDKLLRQGTNSLTQLENTAQSLGKLLGQIRKQHLPEQLNHTLSEINMLVKTYSNGSQTHEELQQTLASLNALLIELEPVITRLNSQPNSLVFGGQRPPQLEPQKAKQ